ncbi:urease accessory protein UreF [Blastococcus mobilis]|uniref:Urease accessory protein UreF n=1 Tax=Blastococcus mobilis TaxID=1938746 RepID=A0A238YES7_9ACTN|nr:urease accessory UreF family protein [Blastococcus mobilis]SNR69735.1 urease accessory protein [Blastococcus mobilis]
MTATTEGLTAFLASLQLTDSAFPSGRYTLSYGLEAFVQAGLVTRATPPDSLQALLTDQIRHGVAPADGTALAYAHRAVPADGGPFDLAAVGRADDRLTAVKLPREARESSARVGRQLLATAASTFGSPVIADYAAAVRAGSHPGNAAVAVGVVGAVLGIPVQHAVAGELYAFAAGWLTAAVRLSVADHRVGQLLLHRLSPVLQDCTATACAGGLSDIRSCTPLADVMAMQHERASLRLFSS